MKLHDLDNKEPIEITDILGLNERPKYRRAKLRWISAGALLCLFLLVAFILSGSGGSVTQYRSEAVKEASFVVTVTATGGLEPVNQVEVGTEVSGTIEKIFVDYNQRVKKGEVLAVLDVARLQAQVLQSEAALSLAKAQLVEAQAGLLESRAELEKLEHVRKLSGGKLPAVHELDVAEAAVKRAEAQEASAKAQIQQAQATLSIQKTDLEKARICSPIDGIVLERAVEPGQTVAASLQTPVLFTIAEDLTKMELHVDVDEADVGEVKEGQHATFTVDAFPHRTFSAVITQVRNAAEAVEGVVTYETLLKVDNNDLALRPGMTATAEITVRDIQNALAVPNAALRFSPREPEVSEEPEPEQGLLAKIMPHPPHRRRSKKQNSSATANGEKKLWVLEDNLSHSVSVRVGATNGQLTEVFSDELRVGMKVIVEEKSK